ncbi:extensin-like domain-containing protein [Pseudogemmobacter bohemicus]|uniref:extensin-like domain-containing protein n=1 Tax=Pseudogemmobacter bohemicus TaxID=2250708 RepID=UPI000DD36FB2|nr:extensin family protein [Pseudogemmobacter bohemicus]
MKARLAALLLLCPLAVLPALAEPLDRSPRPPANPAFTAPVADTTEARAMAMLIGPALPESGIPAAKPAIAAPPVNPRLDMVTLSTLNQAPAAEVAVADMPPDTPMVGEMLPASMPQPLALSAAPVAAAKAALLAGPDLPAAPVAAPALKPRPRPEAVEKRAAARAATPAAAETETAGAAGALPGAAERANTSILVSSLRPKQKPTNILQLASASAPVPSPSPVTVPEKDVGKGKKKLKEPASAKGSVCGVAAIKGENIAPITSKVQGCGLSDGVRVTSVSGVRLSMAATIDCATAKALNTWVERVAQPAYGNQITEFQVAGHYVCRPRNNKKGAKVSEHGRGKAVDISGFRLASGKVIQVLGGFDKTMRKAHKGACGIFGTTLGPGSDGYHEDHLHFDTAAHRSGAYCR